VSNDTKIEWTDATWNPVVGCSIVSPGCTNCYAMTDAYRKGFNPLTPHYHGLTEKMNGHAVWTGRLALAPDRIVEAPLRWRAPRMVSSTVWAVCSTRTRPRHGSTASSR
jgi:protein gp37